MGYFSYEDLVRIAEENLITYNNEDNKAKLHCINAQYIRYMKIEDSHFKRKTQIHWLKEDDAN